MTKIVQFNQTSIYTESFGAPDHPALLLIMGATYSMIWWEEAFINMLTDNGFFVIRYDNRDTGKSTCYRLGSPEYNFEDLADDAIRILDAYEIKQAINYGNVNG